jgi:hypothetical protein
MFCENKWPVTTSNLTADQVVKLTTLQLKVRMYQDREVLKKR